MRNASQNQFNPVEISCYVPMTILGNKIVDRRLILPNFPTHFRSNYIFFFFALKNISSLNEIYKVCYSYAWFLLSMLNVSSSKPLEILADC